MDNNSSVHTAALPIVIIVSQCHACMYDLCSEVIYKHICLNICIYINVHILLKTVVNYMYMLLNYKYDLKYVCVVFKHCFLNVDII